MRNLRKKKKRLTGTPAQVPISPASPADRALLELRAHGRAALTQPTAPSFVIVPYGREESCHKAQIDGRAVYREAGESFEHFERRVVDMFRLAAWPSFALLEDDPPATAPEVVH